MCISLHIHFHNGHKETPFFFSPAPNADVLLFFPNEHPITHVQLATLLSNLEPKTSVTCHDEISSLIMVFCEEEGRYRVVRGMSVTVHSMSLLSLFAVILRCCAPQPPRAFRFLRDRYTQRGLDRTDAMAQNGSAGIINQGA